MVLTRNLLVKQGLANAGPHDGGTEHVVDGQAEAETVRTTSLRLWGDMP
jgi:hypothetical protein